MNININISSDKKRAGRPAKGNDERVTIRLSKNQMDKLEKIGRDYRCLNSNGSVSYSDVIRNMIDGFLTIEQYMLDYILDGMVEMSNHYSKLSDELRALSQNTEEDDKAHYFDDAAHDYAVDASSLLQWVYLLAESLSYEDNRPDIVRRKYDIRRSPKIKNEDLGLYWDDFNKFTVAKAEREYSS